MKKSLLAISLVSVLFLTGCGKAQKLSCESFDKENETNNIECIFKDGKVENCKKTIVREYENAEDAKTYKDETKNIKNMDIKINDRTLTIVVTLDNYNEKSYDDTRKELKNSGYMCK